MTSSWIRVQPMVIGGPDICRCERLAGKADLGCEVFAVSAEPPVTAGFAAKHTDGSPRQSLGKVIEYGAHLSAEWNARQKRHGD